MRASITQVAREAGVTPAVVSRVLNADLTLRVRAETRERVLEVARRLDYTPSRAARSLRRSRSNALGLAVHDMSNPLYGEIIQGAQRAVAAAGYALLLADVDGLARGDESARKSLHGGAIDGLLLQREGTGADRTIIRDASSHIPTVLINDRSRTVASVALDDVEGARIATQHLIDLGHSRIAHLRSSGTQRSDARLRGQRAALARAGFGLDERWVLDGAHTIERGYAAMRELLALPDRPSAVVVANVLSGIGAMTAARDAGLEVPVDLSIIAFHDVEYAAHLSPGLTAVAMPLGQLGARSVELLLELLDGGTARQVTVVDPAPRVVVRGSTAPPRP